MRRGRSVSPRLRRVRLEGYRIRSRGRESLWGAVVVWLAFGALVLMALNVAAMMAFRPPVAGTPAGDQKTGPRATVRPPVAPQPRAPVRQASPTSASPTPGVAAPERAVRGAAEPAPPPAERSESAPASKPLPAAPATGLHPVLPGTDTAGAPAAVPSRPAPFPDLAAAPQAAPGAPGPGLSADAAAAPGPGGTAGASGSGVAGTPGAQAGPVRRYHVQVGVFASRDEAAAVSDQLKRLGYASRVAGTGPFVVRVGGYLDEPTAERLLVNVRSRGFSAELNAEGNTR
jgi:hypothetical protein